MARASNSSGRTGCSIPPRLGSGWLWCLMVGWLGCHDAREPHLPVSEVRYWSMPADGAKVPAPRSAEIDGPETLCPRYGRQGAGVRCPRRIGSSWRMPDSSAGRPEELLVLRDGRIAVADTHVSSSSSVWIPKGTSSNDGGVMARNSGNSIIP